MLEAARAVDRSRARGAKLGPAAGLPFAVKDQIAVAGYPATGGNGALKGYIPKRHAAVVERLVAAGAIPFCKTTLPGHECRRWPHAPDLRAQRVVRRGAQPVRSVAHSGRQQRRKRRHPRRAHRSCRAGTRHQRLDPLSFRVLRRGRTPAFDLHDRKRDQQDEPQTLLGRRPRDSAGAPARHDRADGAHGIGRRVPRHAHHRRSRARGESPRGAHRGTSAGLLGAGRCRSRRRGRRSTRVREVARRRMHARGDRSRWRGQKHRRNDLPAHAGGHVRRRRDGRTTADEPHDGAVAPRERAGRDGGADVSRPSDSRREADVPSGGRADPDLERGRAALRGDLSFAQRASDRVSRRCRSLHLPFVRADRKSRSAR